MSEEIKTFTAIVDAGLTIDEASILVGLALQSGHPIIAAKLQQGIMDIAEPLTAVKAIELNKPTIGGVFPDLRVIRPEGFGVPLELVGSGVPLGLVGSGLDALNYNPLSPLAIAAVDETAGITSDAAPVTIKSEPAIVDGEGSDLA